MSVAIVSKYRELYSNLPNLERAWTITNAVALELGGGWGILIKLSGTNYNGYSLDCLVNKDTGEFVDCLSDSDGNAYPAWQNRDATSSELSAWHAPIGTVVVEPTPTEPTPTEGHTIDEVYAICLSIQAKLSEHLK